MKKSLKLILISLVQLCFVAGAQAQDAGDFSATALDLSRTYPGGSARMQALGGAQTALGGDISSASSNPAGLGFFNRSEFSFSPTFNFVYADTDYLNTSTSDSKLNFNFANLGVVLNKSKGDLVDSKWRGGSFGISLNRIADFQNRITYEGNSFNQLDNGNIVLDPNNPKDFIEYTVLAAGVNNNGDISITNDFVELAYETYLIDAFQINGNEFMVDRDIYVVDENGNLPVDSNGDPVYIPAFPEPQYPTRQYETINSKGGTYQVSLSYGGNYNDKLYFGAGLGILSVDREVERLYRETPTLTTLNQLELRDNYTLSGIGVNATLGIIGRPITSLLLGLSYTTPSYYALEQSREITLGADYLQSTNYRNSYEEWTITYDPFTYNITTPSRLSGGITYFFGKNGFISGDIERVNYHRAKVQNGDDGFSFSPDNQAIDRFESAFNYRVGAEYRIEMFRVRAGYSYMGDPTDDDIDHAENRVSFGGGIRTKDFFVDLGVVSSMGRTSTISPYPGASAAEVTNQNTTATFSVGFFF
ncbi:hypothetical protein C900_04729 [Fulvivirga imtechensis AK7]|uniref:Hemin receptor n=1 Tax=Fulvivirga imtechensis AK7 TaxID=1237149 RepID=L8JQZ7_9BACT|nr:hypothetical protein [Fulvivirga imtechensis]ELR69752.1 hypothetical protein C900_04729 [Fulvivirga imtechensis AK7]